MDDLTYCPSLKYICVWKELVKFFLEELAEFYLLRQGDGIL